jgi:CheY-like chemotaxis protein
MEYKYKKVMVVDDNEPDLYIAEVLMDMTGFAEKVVCVSSAKGALAYLKPLYENPDELPHFIFLDINMPEMNGFDFLKEYQHLPENIRKNCIIMMLTTSLDEHDRVKAESNQFVRKFLNKPLDKDKLAECIGMDHEESDNS